MLDVFSDTRVATEGVPLLHSPLRWFYSGTVPTNLPHAADTKFVLRTH